jgi:hypothetical protein
MYMFKYMHDDVYSCNLFMFLQTKVTTLVEGYGGWALRMEVVPIESAYPGFGKLVVSYMGGKQI